VTRRDVVESVAAPRQVECTRQVQLVVGVSRQVAKVNVRPGDTVHEGDTLVEMDPAPLQKALVR
jgi:multidrug efflux pump subunit AcrA (membrane-fusion protein)